MKALHTENTERPISSFESFRIAFELLSSSLTDELICTLSDAFNYEAK